MVGLLVVLSDLLVRFVDFFRSRVLLSARHRRLELHSVFEYLDLERTNSNLNVVRLLGLERQDGLFDGSEGIVSGVIELGPGVLNGDEEIDALGDADVNVVFLEELNGVSQLREALNGLILDLSHVSQVGHDLSEDLLITIGLKVLGEFLNSSFDFVDETLDVCKLLRGVIVEEACVAVNPAVDDRGELLNQGS